jgi:DNA polymerase III alpha subunit
MPDIDIDFVNRNDILSKIDHVSASRLDHGELKPHNTGIYATDIPVDAVTGLATIDYKTAEDRGYFKIDFLNVGVYNGVRDEAHLTALMNQEPLWELLEDNEFVKLLFHVNGHGDILKQTKPQTVEQLAAVLAIIRPAKRHLVGQDWNTILNEVWQRPQDADAGYYFKKSHAIAYAVAVVVQMNLICENISYGFD